METVESKIYMIIDQNEQTLNSKAYSDFNNCFNDFNDILVNYNLIDDDGVVSSQDDGWGYVGNTIKDLFIEMIDTKKGLNYDNNGMKGTIFVRCS